jgi:hypothetical protein
LCRNFQPIGLYCSLNLGVSGLVQDEASVAYLRENHKIGDIISVEVDEDFDFSAAKETRSRPVVQLVIPGR